MCKVRRFHLFYEVWCGPPIRAERTTCGFRNSDSTGETDEKNSVVTIGMLSLILWVGGVVYCSSNEYSELVSKCKRIKLGDTEEQVLKELGSPPLPRERHKVESEGRQFYSLDYPAPSLESTPPAILIDATSGFVVRITCNDEYTLHEKR